MLTCKDSSKRYNSFMISDILDSLEDDNVIKQSTVNMNDDDDLSDNLDPVIHNDSDPVNCINFDQDQLRPGLDQIALRHHLLTCSNLPTNGSFLAKYYHELNIESRHAHIFYEIQLRRKMMLQSKPRKGGQIRFTHQQTLVLEDRFNRYHYLNSSDRRLLAQELNLTERQVKTWFQNRRAKDRRSKVNSDCVNAIKSGSHSNNNSYFHPWSDDESIDKMDSI